MRLGTGDLTLLDDLRTHFERSGFVVEKTGDADLDVRWPDAPSPDQEAREIELHLQVWHVMHPGTPLSGPETSSRSSYGSAWGSRESQASPDCGASWSRN